MLLDVVGDRNATEIRVISAHTLALVVRALTERLPGDLSLTLTSPPGGAVQVLPGLSLSAA